MKDFRHLKVWDSAHRLALAVYEMTRSFPREERFGLTAQMRSSALSIPANIAEGCGRTAQLDFKRFLDIAMGSLSELQALALLARDLGFLAGKDCVSLEASIVELRKMLAALIVKVAKEFAPRSRA